MSLAERIKEVIQKHMLLNYQGLGLSGVRSELKIDEEREKLIQASESEIKPLVDALSNIKKTKTIRKHYSSYYLKHVFEQRLGCYVSNGSFITAALIAGFRYQRVDNSINAYFDMSLESLIAWEKAAA